MSGILSSAATGFGALTLIRQLGLVIGMGLSVALGIFLVQWASTPDYTPAYTQLDGRDLAPMLESLERHDIQAKVDYSSNSLLVASKDVMKARLKLAGEGLPKQRTGKSQFFEKGSGFGKSQFVEKAAYLSSLEEELALTISQLEPVDGARVHLAIPADRSFVRQTQKPSASVFLNLQPGYVLNQKQVAAVSNLVAASIPGMSFEDVSITDQYGHPLSSHSSDHSDPSKHLDTTMALERKLSERIVNLLTPVVGVGRVRAHVNADVDFTQIEQTQEIVDPDKTAIKIEKMLVEQSGDKGVLGGIPGALSNNPPAPGESLVVDENQEQAKDKGGSIIDTRRQATREYDVEKSVRHTVSSPYAIRKLSVAVIVDDRLTYNPESGEMERQALTEQNIQEMKQIVENAIGFSQERGDSVTINYNPFAQEKPVEKVVEEKAIWQESWFLSAVKQGLAGIIILYILFGLLRPMLKALAKLEPEANRSTHPNHGLSPEDLQLQLAQNKKKDIGEVKALISEDSKRVAQVVDNWMGAKDD